MAAIFNRAGFIPLFFINAWVSETTRAVRSVQTAL
jgi:hypothetical protein